MTLLQLAGMYQAIANDGVRIPPTIVEGDHRRRRSTRRTRPSGVRVMSPQTAQTVLHMLRGHPGRRHLPPRHRAAAAITGYQVAGKTGTAQQVDPDSGEYSKTAITSTFAGIVPADNPKYVIAIMLDNPQGNSPAGTHQLRAAVPRHRRVRDAAADVPPSATGRRSTTCTCPDAGG